MRDIRTRLAAAFHEIVPLVVADIARRHGFHVRSQDENEFVLESSRCRIVVSLGNGHVPDVGVTLAPGRDVRGFPRTAFGLGVVLDHFDDPRVAFAGRPVLSIEQLDEELRRAIHLLVEYCRPMLDGNFSIWPNLQRQSDEALKLFKKGGEARKIWTARQTAFVAFGQGNFKDAVVLYGSIQDHLTPREKKKLEYARKRTS